MIESIELVNWKTHKHTVMKFQNGVNVLIGVMGAGKSSVMDAISFALFGTFPALMHKRISTKELISNRPAIEENAEVKLVFGIGKDKYLVSRKISKKESTASRLEKNGQYLQTQTERVNEEVGGLLKIDYETFSRAIYSEQNRMDYFLELAKGERKRQIDQMLGLDNFAKAEENTTSLVNSMRSMIKDEEQFIAQMDVGAYRKELEALSLDKQKVGADDTKLQEEVVAYRVELKGIEAKLNSAKELQEKRNRFSKEIESLNGRIETIRSEIAKIGEQKRGSEEMDRDLRAKKLEQERLSKETKELKAAESAIVRKVSSLETEIRLLDKKIAELEKIKSALEKDPLNAIETKLKSAQEELASSTKEASSIEGRISEAKKGVSELEKHISTCPICDRELTEELRARLIDEKKGVVLKLESELKLSRSRIRSLEEETKKATDVYNRALNDSKALQEYGVSKESHVAISSTLKTEKSSHEEMSGKMEKSSVALENIAKEISAAEKIVDAAKRRERYEQDVKKLSLEKATKTKELESIKLGDNEMDALQSSFVKSSKMLATSETKMEENKRHLKSIESQIEEKAKSIAKMAEMEDRIKKRRTQIASLNKFKSALVDTETALRSRLVHSINSLMQDIWVQIYPYGDYPGIRLNAGKDDYLLEAATISLDGTEPAWLDINGIASGGERSIACLALRIALSMVIVPNLRWIILDEPTHNIDENGISKLVGVLGESLPKIVEQVFIITHDSALKNISGARVYQLGRDKSKSEHTSFTEL